MSYPDRGPWAFRNITRDFAFWPTLESIQISQEHPDMVATIGARVVDPDESMWFAAEDECEATFDDERIWAGFLKTVTEGGSEVGPREWFIDGQDYTSKLGDALIRRRHKRKREKALRRVRWILSYLRPSIFTLAGRDLSHIPDVYVEGYDYWGSSVAEALQHVADELRMHFYIDLDKVFQMFRAEKVDAPFGLDNLAPNYGEGLNVEPTYPFREWTYARDSVDLANAYLSEPEKRKDSRWVTSPDSILRYDSRQERFISDSNLDGPRQAIAAGSRALALTDMEQVEGRLTSFEPGIWAGQTVHIREALWDHDFDRFVRAVEIVGVDPHDDEGVAYLKSYLTVTDQRRPKLRGRGGQGHHGSINKVIRHRPGQHADTDPHPFEDFREVVAPPTIVPGDSFSASVTRYTVQKGQHGMKVHYAIPGGATYDGPGDLWGPTVASSPTGSPPIESNGAAENQPWTMTPGWMGCGVGAGSWGGWTEKEVWYAVTIPTHPADLAGITFSFTLGLPTNPLGTRAQVRVAAAQPTDTKQGTIVGYALANAVSAILIPASYIPAAGGTLWIGLSPDWQADFSAGQVCGLGFGLPLQNGQNGSARIGGPAAPSGTVWAVYSASGDDMGTTITPGKTTPWEGPHTWHTVTDGPVVWSQDGSNLIVDSSGPGGLGIYVRGDREDDTQPAGVWSDVMFAAELDFKVAGSGNTADPGPRYIELDAIGEGERILGRVRLGDSERPEGIEVLGPTSKAFTAVAIGESERWRALIDCRNGSEVRAKLYPASQTEPAAWTVRCPMDETGDEGDRLSFWVRTDDLEVRLIRIRMLAAAQDGQRVVRELIGTADGVTNVFETVHPFKPGTLTAYVNGVKVAPVVGTETGTTFGLDFHPTAGSIIRATYTVEVVEVAPVPTFVITNGPAAEPTDSNAAISWTCSDVCSGQVEYGATASYGSTTRKQDISGGYASHRQVISGLAAETEYHYRIVSTDAGGNTVRSADATFTTEAAPAEPETPGEPVDPEEGVTYFASVAVPEGITTIAALRNFVFAQVGGPDKLHPTRILLGAGRVYTGPSGFDFKGLHNITFDGEGTETTRNQTGGAIVRVLSSWSGGLTAATFYARSGTAQASAVGIRFVRMGIEGNSTDYATLNAGKGGESQHGIAAYGVDDLEVRHVTFDKNHGDGVYLSSSNPGNTSAHPSMRAYVHDSTIKNNGRMGVAVIHAGDTRVEDVAMQDIAMACFDIEPNMDHEGVFGTTRCQRLLLTGHYSWNDQWADAPFAIVNKGRIEGTIYITDNVNDAESVAPHSAIGFLKGSYEKAPMVKTATLYVERNSNTAGGRPAPAVALKNWKGPVYVRDNVDLVSSGTPYVSDLGGNTGGIVQSGNS